MADLILENISLIILLPLWIFLIIMCGRFFSVYVNKNIINALTLIASGLGIFMCGISLKNIQSPIEWIYPFIKINDFSVSFGLHIDKLSLSIALILFVISFAVQAFSVSYMKDNRASYRFFALLNLFNFGMASLLFSPNLYQFYIFWEVIGIISYLLIGFDYQNPIKSEASKRVFLINRIGDTALLGGIILVSAIMYSYTANPAYTELAFADMNAISAMLEAYTTTPVFNIICSLFIIGAMVKSAQYPFHTWLQEAMEAEIPVSALLHSATMATAGVYLIAKIMPLLTIEASLMTAISIIGILTAIICSLAASIETTPKKVLAYSTSANLGLMFLALGMGNIKAAFILLAAHALIKSMLFILLPNKNNTTTKVELLMFLTGGLSLAGLILAGVPAKEYLYSSLNANSIMSSLFLCASFFTAFYIVRLWFILKQNVNYEYNRTYHLPALCLLILNVIFYIRYRTLGYEVSAPYWIGVCAVIFAIILYKFNLITRFNKVPKITETVCNKFLPAIYGKIADACSYTDIRLLSEYKPIILMSGLLVKIFNWVEINVMNKSVSIVKEGSKNISRLDMVLQSGNVQTYNAYAFILVTIIITLVIIGYTLIITQFA